MVELALSEAAVADDLLTQVNNAWQGLADAVFNPTIIIYSLEEMMKNPLAMSIISALLVVAGFALFARAISIFNTKM